jgi:hypothetical protein
MSLQKFSWDASETVHVDILPTAPARHWRPQTRKDCELGERPCPYVGCRHHLAVHVNGASISHSGGHKRGSKTIEERIKPDTSIEGWSDDMLDVLDVMPQTCALDVADMGGIHLASIGRLLGLSRERVRQIEADGLVKLRKRIDSDDLGGLLDAIASSSLRGESPLKEAQGYASLTPGDVAAMREAKG